MTLNDIIVSALAHLERGHEQQTLEQWRDKFTLFANEAVVDIATSFKLQRTEYVTITGNILPVSSLSRSCISLLSAKAGNTTVYYNNTVGETSFVLPASGIVYVTYLYMPKELARASDIPDIPSFLHSLIVDYVVARERMSGDVSTQDGCSVYMQMYEMSKRKLQRAVHGSARLENKFPR